MAPASAAALAREPFRATSSTRSSRAAGFANSYLKTCLPKVELVNSNSCPRTCFLEPAEFDCQTSMAITVRVEAATDSVRRTSLAATATATGPSWEPGSSTVRARIDS